VGLLYTSRAIMLSAKVLPVRCSTMMGRRELYLLLAALGWSEALILSVILYHEPHDRLGHNQGAESCGLDKAPTNRTVGGQGHAVVSVLA
jgi:hypothetical protein